MRHISAGALAAIVCLAGPCTAFGAIEVSIRDGRVSIVATQATAGEILAEWAKLGQVKVTNLDLLPGERMTIELRDVAEEQALAVVLRRASGYVAARRDGVGPSLSTFERIIVMRTVVAVPIAVNARAANVRPASADDASADPTGDDQVDPDEPTPPGVPPAPRGAAVPPRPANRRADDGAPAGGAAAGSLSSDAAAAPGLQPNQAAVAGVPPAALAQQTSTPLPPRPMTAGQMAGRRPTGPPRDTQTAPPQQVEDANAAATTFDEPAAPTGPVTLPREDPVAQATFKARRAVETVDPRMFDFRMPRAAGKPGTTGATGAKVPGAVVPTPPKTDPVIK